MRIAKTSTKAALVASLALASAAVSQAQVLQTLIDVNIASTGGNGQAVLGGTADTYNNFNPFNGTQNNTTPAATAGQTLFANAVDSTGANTGVTIVTGSGFNSFVDTNGTTANPGFLMSGYAYNSPNAGNFGAFAAPNITLTLSNLSAYNGDTFTLVAYGAGDSSGQGDFFTLSGAATGTGATTGSNRDIANGQGDAYQLFTGTINGDALTITANPNDTTGNNQGPFSALNGFQLQIAVPEPSTWVMMIGGLGLLIVVARGRSRAQI